MAHRLRAMPRQAQTKGDIHRLRRAGLVPISVQHRGEETLLLQEEAKPLEEFIHHHSPSTMIELEIEPEHSVQTVMVHDIQRDPITASLLHVTFQKVEIGEAIKAHVPLVFHGEPEPVRDHTAVVQHPVDSLEIRAEAANLPDHITVDISHLDFNHHELILVSDLPHSDRYEILTHPDTVIAALGSLRKAIAEEEAYEAEQASAPEVAVPE